MRGFGRFKNRRQVASMTGLCPGIHLSDGRGKEGSINRCGISIVRWTLVEMVWRLMIWQPQYPPVRRLAAGLVKSKRARKRLVVQAARRLAIDLWRHKRHPSRKRAPAIYSVARLEPIPLRAEKVTDFGV